MISQPYAWLGIPIALGVIFFGDWAVLLFMGSAKVRKYVDSKMFGDPK